MVARVLALGIWSFVVWVVLTWMFTTVQLVAGAVVAVAVAVALAPLGPVARPWLVADPRRLLAAVRLAISVVARMIAANLRLARRIWTPTIPLRSGMVIVATGERSDGGLTAVGLLTSLIVDNQLIDVDRSRRLLQYHAVVAPEPGEARAAINGPVEWLLAPFLGPAGPTSEAASG